MKNKLKGIICTILVLSICFIITAGVVCNAMTVYASEDAPEFSLTIDKTSAKQGDYVKVTMTVCNDTGMPLTAFMGTISYNSKYYEYLYYILEDDMGQTISCGNGATNVKDNSVVFFYADPSAQVIPGNGKTIKVFSIMCRVLPNCPEGAPYFSAAVEQCYGNANGDHAFTIKNIVQKNVAVKTTAASQSTSSTQKTTQSTESSTTTTASTAYRSKDARLGNLQISPGALNPSFSADNLLYKVEVAYTDNVIRIVAPPNDPNATVEGSGAKPLNPGDNTFIIKVTAEDGTTTREYKLLVHRSEIPEETQATNEPVPDETETINISDADIPGDVVVVTPTDFTEPTQNEEVGSLLNGDEDNEKDDNDSSVLKIIGIAFAEIALFFFGFLSGYYIDKNNKKREMYYNDGGRMRNGYNDTRYNNGYNQNIGQNPNMNDNIYSQQYQQSGQDMYNQNAVYREQYQEPYQEQQYQEQYSAQQYSGQFSDGYQDGYSGDMQNDFPTYDNYNDTGFGQ